jgi:proteasome assembly chaperone (PAC2) family protein
MQKAIILYKEPQLKNPRLIMAWPDTGYVGLRVIDYLKNKLGAKEFGMIEPYDFSSMPWVSVKDGVIEALELMRNGFYYWRSRRKTGSDLIIFKSEQPMAKLYEYVGLVLEVAGQFGVKRLYMAGAFGAVGVTHSEKPPVFGVTNQPDLKEFLENHGVKLYPEYKGMGNIHSLTQWLAKERDIEAISLWSPVPHYIARLPFPWSNYPQSSLTILEKLAEMEDIEIDTGELEAFAKRTETEMGKAYDELYEEAAKEFAYPTVEQPTIYPEGATETISDEELGRMIRDLEDFFKKGKQ